MTQPANMPTPFVPPSGLASSYFAPTFFGSPAPLVIFNREFSYWLACRLKVPVFPAKLPQKRVSYPYLTYLVVDGDSPLKASGPCGLAWRHYQLDAFSNDYAEAEELAEQLRISLAGYAGPCGLATISNANVHRPASNYDNPPDGSDDGVFRFLSEYLVQYVEPPPLL